MRQSVSQGIIRRLTQDVINKIAAGEIVQSAYSVVKELVENSIDAKSTSITVHLAGGDYIKITDDGCGIDRIDLPLLCERFATSKIADVEDLQSLTSFGFRGEALASVSYVAIINVTTKQRQNEIGHFARYQNSLLEEIKPIGCNDGTVIEVTNLFHNMPQRRQQKLEDKKGLLRLVQSFAVHHSSIQFKLFIDNTNEFSSVGQQRSDLMAQIAKTATTNFQYADIDLKQYSAWIECMYSILSSIKAKRDLILFVNDRMVDCDQVKRVIDRVYNTLHQSIYDETGGYHVYVSLRLNPRHVDPNVHPNKKEVRFINESEISKDFEDQLLSLLKMQCKPKFYQQPRKVETVDSDRAKPQYGKTTIRVDPKMQSLDRFIKVNEQRRTLNPPVVVEQRPLVDELKSSLITRLKASLHKPSHEFISQLVFVGCITPEALVVQHKTKLLLLNGVPLLFAFYLNFLINHLQFMPFISEDVKVPDLLMNMMPAQITIEEVKQILLVSGEVSINNDQPLEKAWMALLEVSESLSLLNRDHDERVQASIEAKQGLASEFKDRDSYNAFYRDKVLPSLKQHCIVGNLHLEDHISELLQLESVYSIFERC